MGDDILRVLIASDMHLGYAEKDPIRGEDSFNTFEELLVKANELKASPAERRGKGKRGQDRSCCTDTACRGCCFAPIAMKPDGDGKALGILA